MRTHVFTRILTGTLVVSISALAQTVTAPATMTNIPGLTPQENALRNNQFQQSLAESNAQYDAQIAAQQLAISQAKAAVAQCNSQRDIQQIQSDQAKMQGYAQGLSGAVQAAPATVGDGIKYVQNKWSGDQAVLTKQISDLHDEIQRKSSSEHISWDGQLTSRVRGPSSQDEFESACSNSSVQAGLVSKDANEQRLAQLQLDQCEQKRYTQATNDANNYNATVQAYGTQQQQMSAVGSHLTTDLASLGAQGLMGVLSGAITAGSQAKAEGKIADINNKDCITQANFAVQSAQQQLLNLQKQQAQAVMDLSLQKAQQDLAAQQAAAMKNQTGVVSPGDLPSAVAQSNLNGDPGAGAGVSPPPGDSGAGAGVGGSGPGGGAGFAFGSGNEGEEAAASGLPEQPSGATFSGGALASSNGDGSFGSFGKTPIDPAAAATATGDIKGPAPASLALGDGGLNVLLNRVRMAHARHVGTLLQSLDLNQIATTTMKSGKL